MHDPLSFAPNDITDYRRYHLDSCPACGGKVRPTDSSPRVLQKVELIQLVPWTVTQHEAYGYYCPRCRQVHYADLPPEVQRGGMLGPRLLATIAYLKAVHHGSFSTVARHCRDILQLPLSRGRLAKAVQQASEALAPVHDELCRALLDQPSLRVDETGHKDMGRRLWTWCFRALEFTWFLIDHRRSSGVLFDILGEQFQGVLSCDYFSAYRKYMRLCDIRVQFCLAHLIRDLKYLTTLKDAATAAYGRRLIAKLRELFRLIHEGEDLNPATLRRQLQEQSERILDSATHRVPQSREAQAIARRFRKHGRAYFQFITTPGIEPTNNLAEQAMRFVVIDRRITQGTRGERGQRWCERIWTVLASCAQQSRSALEFLIEAMIAWVHDRAAPSLLPELVPK